MELHAVDFPVLRAEGRDGEGRRRSDRRVARRRGIDVVAVRAPNAQGPSPEPVEKPTRPIRREIGGSVFPLAWEDPPTLVLGNELHPVADPEKRDPGPE